MDSIVMVFPSAFGELGASVSEQLPEPPVTRTLAMSTSGSATNSVIPAPDVVAVASPASKLTPFSAAEMHPKETAPAVLSKKVAVTWLDEKLLR
jgi:hypothetical protein